LKRYGSDRYLSKNNNNILRLNAIRDAFPKATVIIPFRDSVQQAYSLLCQHRLFKQKHKDDPFSKKYMSWLVHHEFGSDHRPFVWCKEQVSGFDPDNLDYWIALWIGVYDHLLIKYHENSSQLILLGYELLCEKKEVIWPKLVSLIDPDNTDKSIPDFSLRTRELEDDIDESLLNRANEIYRQLTGISKKIL
jgi:hypothetical protein